MMYLTFNHFGHLLKTTLLVIVFIGFKNPVSIAGEGDAERFKGLLFAPIDEVNLAEPLGEAPPLEFKMLPVYASSDMKLLLGGITELLPDSGIYITARHVFQNLANSEKDPEAFLAASLNVNRGDLKNFRFYGFISNVTQKTLDAILIIPRGKEDLILSHNMLRFLSHFEFSPSVSMRYISKQFGSLGGDGVEQSSKGKISAVSSSHSILSGDDYFYLPGFGLLDQSSQGSSGALIQTQGKLDATWSIAGIVQCQLKNSGMTRVLSLRALTFAISVEVVNPIDLLKEPTFEWEDDCIILSRRGGGG